jgi:hypothetical protein
LLAGIILSFVGVFPTFRVHTELDVKDTAGNWSKAKIVEIDVKSGNVVCARSVVCVVPARSAVRCV